MEQACCVLQHSLAGLRQRASVACLRLSEAPQQGATLLLRLCVPPASCREYCSTKREKDDPSMEQEGVEWNELRAGVHGLA